ncbi:MAG: right-handed parallel beta-helix repeat-containing protein [Verrucomicrobia bacterium]|nr:right-handed parallel beta-helix repeat-containing protein [Verrucomicrobiota bacterium]
MVILLGHGSGGSVSQLSSGSLAESLRLIGTNGKYFILESCDAGYVFEIFEQSKSMVPQTVILTGSNKADPDSPIQITGTVPLRTIVPTMSAFTDALLSCFSRTETLPEAHRCLTSVTAIGPLALRLKLADPQLRKIGSPDSDSDGVLDQLELDLKINPNNPDTDGDGVIDGVEFGHLANLEKKDAQGIRDGLVALGAKSLSISSAERLPTALNTSGYSYSLEVRNGIPVNALPPSEQNPFGAGPKNGWFVTQGALPAGMRLDRLTGSLSGRPTQFGEFTMTIEHVDAIGAAARKSFRLTATEYGAGRRGGWITVSSAADTNARDDHITLREAVLLATGKLSKDALTEDPNPGDSAYLGERRWVEGNLGADYRNGIRFDGPMTIVLGAPLVLDTVGTSIAMGEKRITLKAANGPIFDFQGSENLLLDVCFMEVQNGPGIVVSGDLNTVGEPFSLWQTPSVSLTGGGSGVGILVTGRHNFISSFRIQKFETGILVAGRADHNQIEFMRCGSNGNGIVLEEQASENWVKRNALGFEFSEDAAHRPFAVPNRENGLVLRGEASLNLIEQCGMSANGANGVLISGPSAAQNLLKNNQVGVFQTFRNVGGNILPNGENGIHITAGAHHTRVFDGLISLNTRHGILISGVGTDENSVGEGGEFGVVIDQPGSLGDAVRVEQGARNNHISPSIRASGQNGIAILGEGTAGNRVTARDYFDGLTHSVRTVGITNAALSGILIGSGASSNLVGGGARVEACAEGIVIDGPSTRNNHVRDLTSTKHARHGVRISGGARENVLGPDVRVLRNAGGGIRISGEGTARNQIIDSSLLNAVGDQRYVIEIGVGAQGNSVSNCIVMTTANGGILLQGPGVDGNEIRNNQILAGVAPENPDAGDGVMISGGAQRNRVLANSIRAGGGYGTRHGIRIEGPGTSGNLVDRNEIYHMRGHGIFILDSPANRIGTPAGEGNDIWGNGQAGIQISGAAAKANRVRANRIGNFAYLKGNSSHGIHISDGASGNRIGGARVVLQNPKAPQLTLKPNAGERGPANLIVGNSGSGIHLENAHGNLMLGNLIGIDEIDFVVRDFGNQGHGISIDGFSTDNRIGNAVTLADRNPGYGNYLHGNKGSAIWMKGKATIGTTILGNTVAKASGDWVSLLEGANHNLVGPSVGAEGNAGPIRGSCTEKGFVEIHSLRADGSGVFHLTAAVGPGEFTIDRIHPESRSVNAVVIDSADPVPYGKLLVSFTAVATGDTSAFILTKYQ